MRIRRHNFRRKTISSLQDWSYSGYQENTVRQRALAEFIFFFGRYEIIKVKHNNVEKINDGEPPVLNI